MSGLSGLHAEASDTEPSRPRKPTSATLTVGWVPVNPSREQIRTAFTHRGRHSHSISRDGERSIPTVSRSVASEHQQMSALLAACSPAMKVPGPSSAASGCRRRAPVLSTPPRSGAAKISLAGNTVAASEELRACWLRTRARVGLKRRLLIGSLMSGNGSIAPAGGGERGSCH